MCSSLQRFSHKPNERFKNSPFPKKILRLANALNLQLIRKSKHYSTIVCYFTIVLPISNEKSNETGEQKLGNKTFFLPHLFYILNEKNY